MDSADCIVAGAGVVGLAIARALAMAGREVIVIEPHLHIGMETSSRNSEVIHAGIYYPQGSLKAELCTAGKAALYALCESHGVHHRRTGKLIVATSEEEVPALAAIRAAAHGNGVTEVDWADPAYVRANEPALRFVRALWSPSTGIVDSHGLMLALQGDAEAHGAMVAFGTRVTGARVTGDGAELLIDDAPEPQLKARTLINAAGLGAIALAKSIAGFPASAIPRAYMAKGSYFALTGRSPFSTLIYPVPVQGGLGVHLTIDLAGQARFGPDVEWIDRPNYSVNPARVARFYEPIRRYWPDLPDGALEPAYAGIRPKLSGPGQVAADFRIDGPQQHGIAGLVNLFGIESPGLTASLAIAERVRAMLETQTH